MTKHRFFVAALAAFVVAAPMPAFAYSSSSSSSSSSFVGGESFNYVDGSAYGNAEFEATSAGPDIIVTISDEQVGGSEEFSDFSFSDWMADYFFSFWTW